MDWTWNWSNTGAIHEYIYYDLSKTAYVLQISTINEFNQKVIDSGHMENMRKTRKKIPKKSCESRIENIEKGAGGGGGGERGGGGGGGKYGRNTFGKRPEGMEKLGERWLMETKNWNLLREKKTKVHIYS